MKKEIRLPSGKLGRYGKVHIDLEMTGKHYDDLTLVDKLNPMPTVVSILTDLMDEDPNQCSVSDVYYLFTLVKASSLGDKLKVRVPCPAYLRKIDTNYVHICANINNITVSIVEDDVKYFPDDEEVPTVIIPYGSTSETYNLKLPTQAEEIQLIQHLQEMGYPLEDFQGSKTKKETVLLYSKYRLVLHIDQHKYSLDEMVENLKNLNFQATKKLYETVAEMDSYGLQHLNHKVTCSKCGYVYDYHLPILAGVSL